MGALDTVIIFDLRQVLSDILLLFKGQAEAKEVRLQLHVAPDVPLALCGNPLALKQVLLHCINHALLYSWGGELQLHADLGRVTDEDIELRLGLSISGGDTVDHGWRQVAAILRGQETAQGSLAPLAVCRRLVAGMGGALRVERVAEHAWRMDLTARMAPDPAMPLLAAEACPLAHGPAGLHGLRAMVADANRVSREQLCGHLASLGMACMAVADGNEAASLLRGNLDFAVLFLDVQLPGQDGIDVYKAMCKVRQPATPTVLTAAYFTERERRKASQAGIQALLEKPVTPEALSKTLTALLGLDRRPPSPSASHIDPQRRELMRGARILVVDDNPLNRDLAREMLEELELELDTAANGHDAVEAVRRQPYDLIFMDVQMPKMDGYAATRVIRTLPQGATAAIIAITANASADYVRACLNAGMDDYLGKPFHRQGLLDMICKWRQRQRDATASAPAPNRASGASTVTAVQAEADTSPPSALPDALPGIDLADGRARFDGNDALLLRFILEFQEEFDDFHAEILLAAAQRDFQRAATLAHTLAGAAANVSATGVHARAKALQDALAGGTLRIKPEWDALQEELHRVCQGIATVQPAMRT